MLKLSMIGTLGADAEIRDAGSKKVISFSLAHNEKYIDRNGAEVKTTHWVKCSLFRAADKTGVAQYLTKGKTIYVEGLPKATAYDKNGVTHTSIELIVSELELT